MLNLQLVLKHLNFLPSTKLVRLPPTLTVLQSELVQCHQCLYFWQELSILVTKKMEVKMIQRIHASQCFQSPPQCLISRPKNRGNIQDSQYTGSMFQCNIPDMLASRIFQNLGTVRTSLQDNNNHLNICCRESGAEALHQFAYLQCSSHILEKVGQSLLCISLWAFGYGDWK